MEGAQGLDFVPDIIDDTDTDLTPDDVKVKPKVDTAERLGVKKKTKVFINKGLKQLRRLQDLQIEIAEEYNEKTVSKTTAERNINKNWWWVFIKRTI